MTKPISIGGLCIDPALYALVRDEIAPGTGVASESFWASFAKIVGMLGPTNRALLEERARLQKSLDSWCLKARARPFEAAEHQALLEKTGYLVSEGEAFQAATENVDREIAQVSGPQLVVPLDNARYSLNAANARWGSLYDAFYGTDVIAEDGGAEKGQSYNPVRGAKVIARTETFLDSAVGLESGKFSEVIRFQLRADGGAAQLLATLTDGRVVGLADRQKFAGYTLEQGELSSVLFKNHELHVEVQLDRSHPIGKLHRAGVKDVLLEAAVTTIQDCEDSVAAVDAADKVRCYRNWNGIMQGSLQATFEKNGRALTRRLNADRTFTAPDGRILTLPGRSLLLVRNVGLHMYTDAVTTSEGAAVPEGFLDAMVTSLAALHDIRRTGAFANSRTGSIYIVKPKLHGPAEVALTVALFARVEEALGLPPNTIKIGIMDEERRLTVNLKESIRAARERVVFINTGFLDRTGDEIHTSMELGPMLPKAEIKNQPWLAAYEDWNVDIGLETGLAGRAQIGKGMWTMPDEMRKMVETKSAHPGAGANTAWVPSPTAATLHALHYHQIDVRGRQAELVRRRRASLRAILTPPLLDRKLSADDIERELENNAQGVLGYVVRWVDQGIGCSKVADIHDVALMEDRATLRISSQHIANWLHHDIVTGRQVRRIFERMAEVVDRQNLGDAHYRPMAPDFDKSLAFQAALDLIFKGRSAPNGYTEPVLHSRRRQVKSQRGAGA